MEQKYLCQEGLLLMNIIYRNDIHQEIGHHTLIYLNRSLDKYSQNFAGAALFNCQKEIERFLIAAAKSG